MQNDVSGLNLVLSKHVAKFLISFNGATLIALKHSKMESVKRLQRHFLIKFKPT